MFNLTQKDSTRTPFEAGTIPDDVIVEAANKYKFVHKINSFVQRLKRAQQNVRSKLKRQNAENSASGITSDSTPMASPVRVLRRDRASLQKDEFAELEGESIHQLLKKMPGADAGKGSQCFNNLVCLVPKGSSDTCFTGPKATENSYLGELKRYGCSGEVKSDIHARILLPPALESQAQEIAPPNFHLTVIEVFVNLPKPVLKPPTGRRPDLQDNDGLVSSNSSVASATVNLNNPASNPNQLYSVDLHEVAA